MGCDTTALQKHWIYRVIPVNLMNSSIIKSLSSNHSTLLVTVPQMTAIKCACKRRSTHIYISSSNYANKSSFLIFNFDIFRPCSCLHANRHQKKQNLGGFFVWVLVLLGHFQAIIKLRIFREQMDESIGKAIQEVLNQ